MLGRFALLAMAALQVTSPAFHDGQTLPKGFTADGGNNSPPLRWSGVPEKTKTLALVVQDPDAPRGTFTHWVVYNIPPTLTSLPVNYHGATQGENDAHQRGWHGPQPPPGKAHHYIFTVYALDSTLTVADPTGPAVLAAMHGHVLAQGSITGLWQQ